jgi:hypothetical protein
MTLALTTLWLMRQWLLITHPVVKRTRRIKMQQLEMGSTLKLLGGGLQVQHILSQLYVNSCHVLLPQYRLQ